jgi:hypothetical protein
MIHTEAQRTWSEKKRIQWMVFLDTRVDSFFKGSFSSLILRKLLASG